MTRDIEIEFRFCAPVSAPKHPIHLESVLLYSSIFKRTPEDEAWDLLDRALATEGEGDDRVYCASALVFHDVQPFVRSSTRRTVAATLAEHMRIANIQYRPNSKLDVGRGPHKNVLRDHPMIWTTHASAWAKVADLNAFGQLLSRVTAIGRDVRLGYGAVSEVRSYPSSDSEAWRRRVLPNPVPGAASIVGPIRPPYWDKSLNREAFIHPYLLENYAF